MCITKLYFNLYFRADVTITDLDELVELMQYNIDKNQALIDERQGMCRSAELTWGKECKDKAADLILMADCIYYEEVCESRGVNN